MNGIRIAGVGWQHRGERLLPVPELALEGVGIIRLDGPNGSGKSTLIELLAGGLAPRSGSVTVCGAPASSPGARRHRRVARTEIALLPELTLRRHASLFARAAGVGTDAALRALTDEELEPRLDTRTGELSTGERRRAWVRLTMLGAAPVLLLDEPFLGLDADAAAGLGARLERWARERMVVLVDHEAHALSGIVDEIRLVERAR